MRLAAALASLLMVVSGPARSSAADAPMPAAEVRSMMADAADVRHALYADVHAQEPRSEDFVNVTVFSGLPPNRFTAYALPTGDGQFRGEFVTQDVVYQGEPKPPRRATFKFSPEASRKIAAILANRALWTEQAARSGECTDQPIVAMEVVWKGHKREAVRMACPPDDLTATLMHTVLVEAREHAGQ